MRISRSSLARTRRFDSFGKPGDVDLMPFLFKVIGRSPGRRPEDDHPIHHVQGDEPLPMLSLEHKKESLFPLGLKRWWNKSQFTQLCVWAIAALAVILLISAIIGRN